jgi:putative iron-regulated protein
MKRTLLMISAGLFLTAQASAAAPDEKAVLTHYADMAHAQYSDSLSSARVLRNSIETLIAQPSEPTLAAARQAWVDARVPYQQTEVFRFGNAIVDDWEGKVNAWPLDEGLIDYVALSYGGESDENLAFRANVIANKQLKVGGQTIDAAIIDKQLLSDTLHELDGVEANVATGYHAIEFLLWGQDLNGVGPGAGKRPASDYDPAHCSGGHCERRIAYLRAATEHLVDELAWMSAQWADEGAARKALFENGAEAGISAIFTGMGSLSYGELAGERMKLGVMLHDPEEEHDCFSDNTHWSHYYDALGIRNVYSGRYTRLDGSLLQGPSVSDLVAAKDPAADKLLRAKLDDTLSKMQSIVEHAENGEHYDQQIAENNPQGNRRVLDAVDALAQQTRAIEKAVTTLGLTPLAIEGSDSLDAPEKVML